MFAVVSQSKTQASTRCPSRHSNHPPHALVWASEFACALQRYGIHREYLYKVLSFPSAKDALSLALRHAADKSVSFVWGFVDEALSNGKI